jgi:hypothetical protein
MYVGRIARMTNSALPGTATCIEAFATTAQPRKGLAWPVRACAMKTVAVVTAIRKFFDA